MSDRLISADVLKSSILQWQFKIGQDGVWYVLGLIDSTPTIESEPVEHGHWVAMNADGRGYADEFGCTNCSCVVKYPYFTKGCDYERCPYCGAKMDEVNNG